MAVTTPPRGARLGPSGAPGAHGRARARDRELLLVLALVDVLLDGRADHLPAGIRLRVRLAGEQDRRLRLRRVRRNGNCGDGSALLQRVPGDVRDVRQVPVPAHLRRDSRCARRHEELVTAEALWIATRAGVYGCVPMLVALAFGLDPAWGMLTVPGIAFLAGFGWACFGISVAGYATSIEIQLHRQRRSHATVPRRRHVLPVERAAAMGTDRG